MAKQIKTVGKTTNTKKGATDMTVANALTLFMLEYNRYQEYRKDNKQSYNFVNKQQVAEFAKQLTSNELQTLAKSYVYQRQMQTKLAKYQQHERALNRAYGKEDTHFMELTDEEREYINKRRAKQEAKKASKKGGE